MHQGTVLPRLSNNFFLTPGTFRRGIILVNFTVSFDNEARSKKQIVLTMLYSITSPAKM